MLLPFCAVVFGAIEMDRLLLAYTSVANAARASVRYAAVHGYFNPTTTSEIQTVAKNFVNMGLIDPSTVTASVSYSNVNHTVGSSVSVTVQAPYAPFTSFFPLNVRLKSTSKASLTF
jgi:Flp pilus assembly protein TadG